MDTDAGPGVVTAWSALLTLALGVAIGGSGVYLTIRRDAEMVALRHRDARVRVLGRPTHPPRSHCRRIDEQENRHG